MFGKVKVKKSVIEIKKVMKKGRTHCKIEFGMPNEFLSVIAIFIINCTFVAAQWNPTQSSCAGRLDGYVFPDQHFCDSFVQCQSGATIKQRCPEGRFFDMTLYYCVASHAVDCGTRAKPPNHNSSPRIPNQPEAPVAPPQWWPENPPSSESHHSVRNLINSGNCKGNQISNLL